VKAIWIVLGILGGLCLLCGGGASLLFFKGKANADEAGSFGDQTFKTIATSWNPTSFSQLADPQIAKENGPEAIPQLMQLLSSRLGPVKTFTSHLTGINSQANTSGSYTLVDWNANATFEKSSGHVTMQLINRGQGWKVLKFDVESPALKDQSGAAAPDEKKL
jgi:hypothetical protein